MKREKDILIIEDLGTFENLANKDPKPYQAGLLVMPGTLQDEYKNIDPQKGVPALRRRFNFIYLFLGGELKVHIGDVYRFLQPNDLVIVPENMVCAAPIICQCQGYYIHFKTEFIQSFLKGPITLEFPFLDSEAEHVIQLNPEESHLIQQAFKEIILEFKSNSKEKDPLLKHYLEILLLRIREIYRPHEKIRPKTGSSTIKLAKNFKHLVEKNFVEIRKVKQYADMLNISPGHLADTVQKAWGKSPKEIINDVLLLEAKALLGNTDKSISEIAFRLRFDDQPHFNHFIKQHTGASPKELRKIL